MNTLNGYHRDIDGVRFALEARISAVGDGLSDIYKDLWEVATEPDSTFTRRRLAASERGKSLDERRTAKVLRRLGILGYAESEVCWRLNRGDTEEPSLEQLYRSTLEQIADMYSISAMDLAARVEVLKANPSARPPYLRR